MVHLPGGRFPRIDGTQKLSPRQIVNFHESYNSEFIQQYLSGFPWKRLQLKYFKKFKIVLRVEFDT